MLGSAVEETEIRVLVVEVGLIRIGLDQSDQLTRHTDAIVHRGNAGMTTGHADNNININISLFSNTRNGEVGAPALNVDSTLINNSGDGVVPKLLEKVIGEMICALSAGDLFIKSERKDECPLGLEIGRNESFNS
jgi:hypothetical protein